MSERIAGIGIDMIEIQRIAKALQRPGFKDRIYTAEEQALLAGRPAESWAGRFAAKEAVLKALGCGWQRGVGFNQISIERNSLGRPTVVLRGSAAKWAEDRSITRVLISISHSKNDAVAQAMAIEELRPCEL